MGSGPLFGLSGDAWPQVFNPMVSGIVGPTGEVTRLITGIPSFLFVDVVALGITPGYVLTDVSYAITFTTQ